MPLPIDPLYCPKLSCIVFDYIFKGWNQPQVGVFTLPIGQYMIDLKNEREKETMEIENINTALTEILSGKLGPVDLSVSDNNVSNNIGHINKTELNLSSKQSDANMAFGESVANPSGQIEEKDGKDYEGTKRRKRKGQKSNPNSVIKEDSEFGKDAMENLGVNSIEAEYREE